MSYGKHRKVQNLLAVTSCRRTPQTLHWKYRWIPPSRRTRTRKQLLCSSSGAALDSQFGEFFQRLRSWLEAKIDHYNHEIPHERINIDISAFSHNHAATPQFALHWWLAVLLGVLPLQKKSRPADSAGEKYQCTEMPDISTAVLESSASMNRLSTSFSMFAPAGIRLSRGGAQIRFTYDLFLTFLMKRHKFARSNSSPWHKMFATMSQTSSSNVSSSNKCCNLWLRHSNAKCQNVSGLQSSKLQNTDFSRLLLVS